MVVPGCSLVPKESLGMRLFGRVFEGLFAEDLVTASKGYGLQNDVNRVFYFQRANARSRGNCTADLSP